MSPLRQRAGHLLSLVDRWIDDIRAHAGEPEAWRLPERPSSCAGRP